jgi:hypothetical protein
MHSTSRDVHMTIRRALLPSLFLASTLAYPATLVAQAASDSSCSYTQCALKVDYGFFTTQLKRGASEKSAGRLWLFGSGVGALLAGSDSAAHYARQYQSRRTIADALGITGLALALTAVWTTEDFRDSGPLILGTVLLDLAALPFHLGARRSLERSVWWYNRDLPRP